MIRLRPDLLVAVSVPVLLVAGVLPWQRDRMCTEAGCGDVLASAWTGSAAWALVVLAGLATAGAWVLLLPVRGRVPIGLAAATTAVAVLAVAVVVISADALVFGHTGLISFKLPVTETFPVLAVHPGEGLGLGLVGLLLQAFAGWTTLRHRNALVSPFHPPPTRLASAGPPAPSWPPAGPAAPGTWETATFGQGPPPPRRRHG